ncbi:MAG: hypothetical protein AB7U95_39425, partial [Reyranella sp.]
DAALVVIDDQAFQHVVDLLQSDRQLEGGVALDSGLVLELSQPAGRQHDALQRKLLGGGQSGKRKQAHEGHDGQKIVHELSRAMLDYRERRV